jgi:hypothetical protein
MEPFSQVILFHFLVVIWKQEYPFRQVSILLHEVGLNEIIWISTYNYSLIHRLHLVDCFFESLIDCFISHASNIFGLQQSAKVNQFEVKFVADDRG